MSPQEREPDVDAPLRAALDHAPDHDLRPPPAVRAAVLRAAHAAVPPRPARWRRWLGLGGGEGWGSPRLWTAVASVASLGLALNLAWHVSTTPEATDDGVRADIPPARAASGMAPPVAKVAEAAPPAAAPANVPPVAREERRRLDHLSQARERAVATPPPEKPPAAAAAPRLEATSVAPPPPPAATAPVAAATATAEAAAPAPQAPGAVVDRRAELSLPAAKRGLADAAPMAMWQAVANPWPEPLARLSTALAADGDWPAAGWQVKPLHGAAAAPPKAWWRSLLQASAGRWQVGPGPLPVEVPATPAWQVSAPDGSHFALTLVGGTAWLQAGGDTWRAAPAPPLP